MYCPNCGCDNEENAKFCKDCGEKLEAQTAPTTTNQNEKHKKIIILLIIKG